MEDVFKTLDLSDDNKNFRGYTTMIELYHALKFITMLLFIQKTSRFNLAVAFLKSVSIYHFKDLYSTAPKRGSVFIGLMTPDGAIWSRYQRTVLMR